MSGVIRSVITNSSAMVALTSLNTFNSQSNMAQAAVSIGDYASSAVHSIKGGFSVVNSKIGSQPSITESSPLNNSTSLNNGIGLLIDTDMAQESAKLQSLQIQQQLARSALSIVNQAPSLLTKLFS